MTSGLPLWAFGAVGLLTLGFVTVDVFSVQHDAPEFREPARLASLVTWEATSGAMVLLLMPFIAWAAVTPLPSRIGWPRTLMWHAAACLAFFVAHVGGFVLLRKAIYALRGSHYVFGGADQWLYEMRKDVLTYALQSAFFLGARAIAGGTAASDPATTAPAAAAYFDIRDGARVIRTPVADILAVASAGNYVEFHLADGRKPLMRTTLAAMETSLAPHGFLRTHRSWLVNGARVREIGPSGSGDRRLALEGGVEAPLSRRYPQALAALTDASRAAP